MVQTKRAAIDRRRSKKPNHVATAEPPEKTHDKQHEDIGIPGPRSPEHQGWPFAKHSAAEISEESFKEQIIQKRSYTTPEKYITSQQRGTGKNGRKKSMHNPPLEQTDANSASLDYEVDNRCEEVSQKEEKMQNQLSTRKRRFQRRQPTGKDVDVPSSDSEELVVEKNFRDVKNKPPMHKPRRSKDNKKDFTKKKESDNQKALSPHLDRQRRKVSDSKTYTDIEHSDIDVEDAEIGNTPPKSKRVVRNRGKPDSSHKKNFHTAIQGDHEPEQYPSPTNQRRTSGRRSAERAKLKFSVASSEDDDSFNDLPLISSQKSRKIKDDDEEFAEEQNSEESDEEIDDQKLNYLDDSDDYYDEVESKKLKTVRNSTAANVDNDDIFDEEGSSDDEVQKPSTTTSPILEIRATPRKRRQYSSQPEGDEEDEPIFIAPHMPRCSSTHDAITMHQLPHCHVCYLPPDGLSRQCFALETLHKIAFSNTPCIDGAGNTTFKQPPHFRSGISDDLIDQIASRFGRGALDLSSEFYNRKKSSPSTSSPDITKRPRNDFGYMVNFDGTLADNSQFNEMVDQYMSRFMGSKDIYCCPVCYAEAFRRLTFGKEKDFDPDDDSESALGDENTEFRTSDPISVLGCLDNEKYKLASTFCFRKLIDVKLHLRDDHGLDTKQIDGSDLYKRFQIRAADGLLQRHLERRFKGKPNHGYMLMYWNEGNCDIFIYLLHLLERSKLLREEAIIENENSMGHTEARDFVDSMNMFWQSFQSRAQRLWDRLSSPYQKATKEELDDFFAEEDDEVEVLEHRASVKSTLKKVYSDVFTPEDEIIASLKAKRASRGGLDEESDFDEVEGSASDTEELEVEGSPVGDIHPAYYSEEEEESDDWMKERLNRRKTKSRAPKPLGKEIGPKKLGSKSKSNTSCNQNSLIPNISKFSEQRSTQKRRRIVAHSDDE